jgi:hypothetical protein
LSDLYTLETLTDQDVKVNEGTSANCFQLTSTTSEASFQIIFDTIVRVLGVVYVTQIAQDSPILSGEKFSTNIEVSTDSETCGVILDATSNPEVTCAELTKTVTF